MDARGHDRSSSASVCDSGADESWGFTLSNPTGLGQVTAINTVFASPLGLSVSADNSNEPVNGGMVTFTSPSSGAATNPAVNVASIAGGSVSKYVKANGTAGIYLVTANASGAPSLDFSLINCIYSPVVTNNADNGPGSLRQAIEVACSGETVTFQGDYTITLASTLYVTRSMNIDGSGHQITINGNGGSGVGGSGGVGAFSIVSSANVTLKTLTITNGRSDQGAGIYNEGNLTIYNSTVSKNQTSLSPFSVDRGGAIMNKGTLKVYNSTISGNQSTEGGAIYNDYNASASLFGSTVVDNQAGAGGGVLNEGALTIANSTLTGNLASMGGSSLPDQRTSQGGAIWDGNLDSMNIINSTIAGNSAYAEGGNIFIDYGGGSTATLKNTIVAKPTLGTNCARAAITDGGNNLAYGDSSCPGTFLNADPVLGPLADNGGPTQTMALLSGSAASGAGSYPTCTSDPVNGKDQRGVSRLTAAGTCDIGAFEATVDTSAPVVDRFTVNSPISTLTFPISAFEAHDDVGVIGFLITQSGTQPLARDPGWIVTAPLKYTVGGIGTYTLYPWAKDAAGNVSAVFGTGATVLVCYQNITVMNNNDSGAGSLRQAITDLCPDGTITFDNNYTITLAGTLPDLNKNMTIDGGSYNITVDGGGGGGGGGGWRVFKITAASNVTLKNLIIQNGRADSGAGVDNLGTLAVVNDTFTGNEASSYGGGIDNEQLASLTVTDSIFNSNSATQAGGGIFTASSMSVTGSSFDGNSTALEGGGLYAAGVTSIVHVTSCTFLDNSATDGNDSYGGAIGNDITMYITGSTFYDNSAVLAGGAIYNSGILNVSNSTLQGNSATYEFGGIYSQAAQLTLISSTLSGNTGANGSDLANNEGSLSFTNNIIAGLGTPVDCYNNGTITSNQNNLVQDGSCSAALSGDPLLGSLGDNGGPTQTMALLPGSPAIDAGVADPSVMTDQRGVPRPQGSGVDIGAFELRTCTVTTDADGTTPIPSGSLREKVTDRTCSLINFDADHTITLGSALPYLGLGLTIDGGSHHVTVDGGGIVTVFTIPQFADVALNALTITHGHNQGIANYAHLTITNSTITDNSSDIDGGGILNEGTLTVTNSTIANNNAGTDGGGIYNYSGQLTLLNNTLAGNSAGQHGAGLSNETTRGGSLYLANNIIAGSTATVCYTTVNSKNKTFMNNLIQHGCPTLSLSDPLLGPLQDNGGPTQTMALLPGSPAIDAGVSTSPQGTQICPATDQRGLPRPQGLGCDIGAYEVQPAASHTLVTFEAGPYTYRGTAFTATAVVTGSGGLNQAVTVSYSGDCTNVSAGGCTASASYPGDDTHTASSDSKTITITPATLTVTPDAKSLTYADPVPAGTFYTFSVTGFVNGENASTALAYSAPTCGSAYTTTSPASPPTLLISCGGNPNGTAGSATDYTFNYTATAALTVGKSSSTTSITWEPAPYTYRGTAFTATAVVIGAGGLNQAVPVTYTGNCKNVTVTNGCTASASYPGDANHTPSSDSKSITITQALLTVSPSPINPSVQYSDASPAISPSITGFVNGETASVLSKQPTCSTTRTVNSPAGTYPITCSGGTAANYSFKYVNGTFTVSQEDAFLQYSGDSLAQINTNLNLRLTVWDSAAVGYPSTSPNPESKPKATIGDITKIWVQFNIYPEASCGTAGSTVAVLYAQVIDAPTLNDGIGTASITWKSSTEASYCVIARLVGDKTGATNLYYTAADAESAGILFYQNSGKFAAGGGWIKDPGGLPGSFSLLARYDSKGNPFGQLVYVYNGTYTLNGVKIPAVYVIRSTALTAFSISGTNYPLTATLQGKCTIWVMRAFGGAPLYSDFNATCKAVAVDTNKTPAPGGDSFALTVWDKNGVVYKTVPTSSLTLGNVVIHLK